MMVFDTTGMPYSKAKAKMSGKGPRALDIEAQASQASQPIRKARVLGRILMHV